MNLHSPNLLNEMMNFCDKKDSEIKASKALRVINKCRLNGHNAIADKIESKYKNTFPKRDSVIAFGIALTVLNQLNNK